MPERAFGRTDDFLTNGEHAAQKFLFATLVNAGKTILFEPDGIVRQRGRGVDHHPRPERRPVLKRPRLSPRDEPAFALATGSGKEGVRARFKSANWVLL